MNEQAKTPTDYSASLNLPQTTFPMRGALPQKEPEILAHWERIDLYAQLRANASAKQKFVLHDGPPYANGNIHIGHALNKILKDLVTRSQQMLGKDSNYVPGWDCHGLPIEWKIEEEYRAKGLNKDAVPVAEFRQQCRAFAQKWVDIQREEFKRLGITGDWAHPYLTMSYAAEAQIAREIMKFAANGLLYRGSKPVMWSVVEKTALAEAEVEYEDYVSDAVYVAFPVRCVIAENVLSDPLDIAYAKVVIWTTTPWTMPGNRAIAFSSKISYGLYRVTSAPEGNWVNAQDTFILADKLASDVFKAAKIEEGGFERLRGLDARQLANYTTDHPLRKWRDDNSHLGLWPQYPIAIPLLEGDYVTDDTGTGFVHMAPGHGREDFDLWMANGQSLAARNIDTHIPYMVDASGFYTDEAPGFGPAATDGHPGRVITDKGDKGNANQMVIDALISAGNLVARGRLKHQYPHSWRSKKPIIYRNTPQWFIAMDKKFVVPERPHFDPHTNHPHPNPLPQSAGEGERPHPNPLPQSAGEGERPHPNPLPQSAGEGDVGRERPPLPSFTGEGWGEGTLRTLALSAITQTQWVPASGQNRITGMIANRPDWVVSRQRAWGVPIAVFVEKGDQRTLLVDASVNTRIADAFEAEGADAWFAPGAAARFLGDAYNPADYTMVSDVLDVWFDSGSTHAFVLDDKRHFPALANIHRKIDGGADEVMYLEGTDQHRGWFHSSLLEGCGTRGRAPYDIVLTHGFTLDDKGRKMSKSLGNTIVPQKIIEESGADILRLWTASVDYSDDQRIGKEILKSISDNYRKIRNTLRWMLGTLAHYESQDAPGFQGMGEIEQIMLHKLVEQDGLIRAAYAAFDYNKVLTSLTTFVTHDLSAFYFDVRKDALYCEPLDSVKRKGALEVIEHIFRCVTVWLAPILVFTCEEAWRTRYPTAPSVHLEVFPDIPASWRNDALAEKWTLVRKVRAVVTGALEIERANKKIGSSLEAAPLVFIADANYRDGLQGIDLAEVCITSDIFVNQSETVPADAFHLPDVPGVGVVFAPASGIKCARSWKYFDAATAAPDFPDVTPRDAMALRQLQAAGLWPV